MAWIVAAKPRLKRLCLNCSGSTLRSTRFKHRTAREARFVVMPKPRQVIDKLVEGTGGMIFSIDEPSVAAKSICDELRKNRYVVSYVPSSTPFGEPRSLLVLGDEGIAVRSKTAQQPN